MTDRNGTPDEINQDNQGAQPEGSRPNVHAYLLDMLKEARKSERHMVEAAETVKAAYDLMNERNSVFEYLSQTALMLHYLAQYGAIELKENAAEYAPETAALDAAGKMLKAIQARARADGIEIPLLYTDPDFFQIGLRPRKTSNQGTSEGPEAVQIEMQLDIPTDKEAARRAHIEEGYKRRELARQNGVLIDGDLFPATIADKGIGFGYFTQCAIKALPGDIKDFILDKQGRINLYDLTHGEKPVEDVLREVDGIHGAFLMSLLALANMSDVRETGTGNPLIPINLPDIFNQWGIDARPRKRDKETKQLSKRDTKLTLAESRRIRFEEFLSPLRNVAAFFGNDLYQVVGFDHWEAETETIYLTAPYIFKLVEYSKLHAEKHSAIKNIFHADIMTENQAAVEVANRIAMGLITRGITIPDSDTYRSEIPRKPIKRKTTRTDPDGTTTVEELTYAPEPIATVTQSRTENGITTTVTGPQRKKKTFTFSPRFSTLIDDCPQLQRELEEIRNGGGANKSQRTNKKLKDTFTAAIRIITEKSEIPRYYKNLSIKTGNFDTFKAPTNSTLSDRLIITHNGKDPSFSAK